ncbi:MAG: right-handed parallel beta-helix repeat-containing protein [Thermoplasmata archaeon]|nr:MAG: right-handed parallel beta-helix repeat-containing protein [Thermoplasmata archaeon]
MLAIVLAVAAIAFVLVTSDGVEAGGNGDYPPPATGNWYINQPTNVWSESIEMRGSIIVYSSLSMNMVNLTMNCSWNLQYEIRITGSGSLTFTNGNITSLNKSYHYRFRAYNTTTIRNSDLSEAYYGIEVDTKQLTLTDNRIFDMYGYGVDMSLWYTLTGNVLIKGNDFFSNRNYGIRIYQNAYLNRQDYDAVMTGDITIQDNKFRNNLGGGIYAYRYMYIYYSHESKMFTNLTIEGNEMTGNRGYSLYVYTRLYNYQGADDGKITYKGAINVNNNTIKDNSGYYSVYYYNDIDVYYGSDALIDSDINMVGNVITGNKGAYTVYFNNNIYEYYGRDAQVRINLRMEANNISANGGHAVYVNSVTNTNHGGTGVCTNDGDIVFKDNNILNNQGSGVYIYRYAYSSYAAYSSITGDITFEGNTVRNNQGYGGTYIYLFAYKARGDANGTAKIEGDVRFANNTYTGNLGYGVYMRGYTRTYYGSTSAIMGDVEFEGNTINKNTGYGAYVYYDAYKSEGGASGTAQVISNATYKSNTMSSNSGWHGFYYYKYARAYYASYAYLNGTVTADGNTIEDNKGYGMYITANCYNYRGALGNTFISGDIWVRNNKVNRNGGGGIYLNCYSNSFRAKSADVYQNITFQGNTVTANGYSGFVVTVAAYSDRSVGGDTNVVGTMSWLGNTVSSNLYNGIYLYRYAGAQYTVGTSVSLRGDIILEGNTANSNYNYGIHIYNSVWNTQAGLSGHSEMVADYVVKNNTVSDNLYWAAMYLVRNVGAYYTGTAVMDSDMEIEDNVVTSNRGTGVFVDDNGNQYYYGGAGNPDRGNFTQKGTMGIYRNRIETNAGTGLYLASTIDAEIRKIEPAPMIMDNSISYNGGDFGIYCDLRDITEPIRIERNDLEYNEVEFVALISNSGTSPDLMFRNNDIRYNDVGDTTIGLMVGSGDYNATFTQNNVSHNDAANYVLAFASTGKVKVTQNEFWDNINCTGVMVVSGNANTSTIEITDNVVRDNYGIGMYVSSLGIITIERNEVWDNTDHGIVAATDLAQPVIEAEIYVSNNEVLRNGGNGIWTVSMNVVEVTDNEIIGNGQAGIRVLAMKEKPDLSDNTIDDNGIGLYLSGDNLAPLTTEYTFQDLTITDSTQEGLVAEDLTVVLRSCTITGSGAADLAVRRARIDCYATTVGYASGHVYISGHIKVWWRIDIDVEWQSGSTVPYAKVVMASDYDNRTYRDLETDHDGHINAFNVEEWSMVDEQVNRWSPFRCTASKNTESSTQVETVDRDRNILIVLVDAHVPDVTITEPAEGALLNYSIVRFAGTAGDSGSGLVTVRIRVGADDWTDLGKVTTFSKLLPITDGTHTITVQAEDVAGMLGNATVNITIDTVPPRLMVISPEEGLLTNSTEITVEGRVMEPGLTVWIGEVRQSITDNEFADVVRLYEGPNTIRVFATDLAGNERTILRNVTLDTIPPELHVDFPQDHHLTRDPVLTCTGRSEPGATVTVGPNETLVDATGTFSVQMVLAEGANSLSITARDPAGNGWTIYRTVTLDTVPPMLTIEEPQDQLLTRDDKVRVAGLVEDSEGIVLSVGGSFVLPVDGFYEYTISITEGENLIVVTAFDAAGNRADVNRTVIRRTQPPMLEITRPEYDYVITNEVDYRIEGITDPDVDLTVAGILVDVDEEGAFTGFVRLTTGENVISVAAVDALGNRADRTVRLILDTEPPSLQILNPVDGYTTDANNLTISGRTDVGSNLTIDGEEVSVDDKGMFDHNVPLKLGRQAFNVTATDQAGNEATISLNVERVTPESPPDILDPPSTGGSTALILGLILVLAIAGGAGWMLFQQKRKEKAE